MSLLWVLCFPVAAVMVAAAAEWAVGRRTTGAARMAPARVIVFDPGRRRTLYASYRAAAPEAGGPAQVIMLRDARRRRILTTQPKTPERTFQAASEPVTRRVDALKRQIVIDR